ncbi:myosin-binding striated muscle assembly central-domain-containing protein [Amylocarpus encephaloides]|uniref:Myosin-binding striated muscle assembly central-domain-containing protein n=1 Tax=Amylocarpus encephaloides TaxID=45428 RepID=A0A9P8C2U7_9HELO|nr:myosin-binding striated muscle assembly central-domain-containing protein [Amylocarpus encephaloides]
MGSPSEKIFDSSVPASPSSVLEQSQNASLEDKTVFLLAGLMEAGQEDENTCKELSTLTKLLSDDSSDETRSPEPHQPLYQLIDADSVETILGYLDMRQSANVRGYATLTTSAYLKASGDKGVEYLSQFFYSRVRKGTYDDFILAFSVAACIFPIVPDVTATLFLSEGFVGSLGPLMRRKWKSKKVEQAALEMLNVACMNTPCREAIKKYCSEWLEDMVTYVPPKVEEFSATESPRNAEDGSIQQRTHSASVVNLAAVVLAKLQVVPAAPATNTEDRIQPATTSMEELSDMFKGMLSTETSRQSSIEGLAYASLQSNVKEKLSSDKAFLEDLIKALAEAPPRSPATYGALSVLVNLTSYMPALSEEQRRISQLKAYANASKSPGAPDPLNDDDHVSKRCQAVFDTGAIPVLVTHSQHGSVASLGLVVSIVFSISKNSKLRGQMAQQGAVKLLLHAYSVFPTESVAARRTTAHALARILISTNPLHLFGGSNPLPLTSAIRPLLLLLSDDPSSEQRDLLPVFESLLALTNLASTDDTARNPMIRNSFPQIEELLLSNNKMITRATVELICNLMQTPEGIAKFADGSKPASQRMHILLALTDSEDFETRRAAGGALASLTEWDTAVNAILERDRGVGLLLVMCKEESEELRHRGVVCVLNVINAPAKVGEWGMKKVREEGGVDSLKECLKKSRSQEVLEVTVEALKKLLEDEKAGGGQKLIE